MRTGGPWSFEEKRLHINCLELLADSLAIKTFTKSRACAQKKLETFCWRPGDKTPVVPMPLPGVSGLAVLPLIDSWKVDFHPSVFQLLRGIFNLPPPQPKYSHTWKVSQVLGYVKSLGPNENLSLKNWPFKLVTLLGLTAPDRSSDLAKRDLRWRTFHPEGVSFSLSDLSKTSKPGDTPKTSYHAAFREDKDLCPVECLMFYEIKTKEFRSVDEHNKLFLSHILPHNPVSSSTLARWIKSMLQLAGADTSIFTAHSLRGAATTEALNHGVSITDILGIADWSQESTSARFYYKPRFDVSPGNAVLSAYHS
ncbi:Integrase recombinase xerD [Paramuricea clavata]|uniref:Integrase recombinase xerD n=1 Tax=Paramuricea clavata TaxID=317549 RepID=A0A6S7GP03_PARCT|nr:Integrase recombinase xerD [Paramuricea clavata]